MVLVSITRHVWLAILFLFSKAEADCVGDTATYNESGLVVPFKNLCQQDISAAVDSGDPSNETSRAQCISRCVKKVPICYGLDYVEDDSASYNCWLMTGYFNESQTTATGHTNAAMLDSKFLAALSGECIQLGVYGCWTKNGQVGTATASRGVVSLASTRTASITPTSTTSAMSTSSPNHGLSTGAKAGIGAGVGVAALLGIICAVLLLLKRRRKGESSAQDVTHVHEVHQTEKYAYRSNHDGMSELPGHDSQHVRAELESPGPIKALKQ